MVIFGIMVLSYGKFFWSAEFYLFGRPVLVYGPPLLESYSSVNLRKTFELNLIEKNSGR